MWIICQSVLVFATATKKDHATPFGLQALKEVNQISKHPLVAIGGINEENLDSVLDCGVEGVALVSLLCEAPSPRKKAEELRRRIQKKLSKKKRRQNMKTSFDFSDSSSVRRLLNVSEKEMIHLLRNKLSLSSSDSVKEAKPLLTFPFSHREGEDAALIPKQERISYLISTDSLVENIHFLRDKMSPFDLAYKSLAVNLSDIAAMGGKPLSFFLSLSLPKDLSFDWLNSFAEGLRELAKVFRLKLEGGDTTTSLRDIFINVTVLGEIETQKVKLRSGARPGDVICVTGPLGDSRAGLKCLLRGERKKRENAKNSKDKKVFEGSFKAYEKELIQKHLRPFPHVSEGLWLSKFLSVHSMMDVSDGLYVDLKRLMEASQFGAKIFLDQIPTSSAFRKLCRDLKLKEKEEALMGGEDYVLLFTVEEKSVQSLRQAFSKDFSFSFFPIGHVMEKGIQFFSGDREVKITDKSFSHFS